MSKSNEPYNATWSTVAIAQGSAGRTQIKAAATGKVNRLHALIGTVDAAGTVKVRYADGDNDTNAVDLTGAMPVGTRAGSVIPFESDKRGVPSAASGKSLQIFTATGKFFGYAVVSQAAD